jgi:hypothetical protein
METQPDTKVEALRGLAREFRAQAETDHARSRYARPSRDGILRYAESLEHEAEHEEARAAQACLADALAELQGSVYEVERDDSTGFSYLGCSALRGREPRARVDVLQRNLREHGTLYVFVPDHATGSDYGGDGALGKANLRDMLEAVREDGLVEGEDYWQLSGGHGTYGLALRFDVRSDAIVGILTGLADYPAICDETVSEVEMEEKNEAWDSFVRADFRGAVERACSVDLYSVDDNAVYEMFLDACERASIYWSHSTEGAWIDVERVAQAVSRDAALALPGAVPEEE